MNLISKLILKNKFIVLGHRGCPQIYLENTMPSFLKALEKKNWQGIEIDVQLSKDNKVIIFHDENLKRLGNTNLNISDLNYNEIKNINLKDNHKIPLLTDLLQNYPKDKIINIEIKKYASSKIGIEKNIVLLVKKYNLYEQCIISSFYPQIIRKVKKLDSKIITALLWTKLNLFPRLLLSFNLWWSKPDGFHPNIKYLDEKIIKIVKSKKMFSITYTVDKQQELKKAFSLKLNGIVTNNNDLQIK